LGNVLKSRGLFAEALGYLQKGHELGSRQPGWRYPSARWVSDCRRLVELEPRFLAILKGEVSPKDADERIVLADFCYQKALYTTSARFYVQAFAEQPPLAENLGADYRYVAACAAALAGSGVGKDDPPPDEAARAKLRELALGWLRADLTAWGKGLDGGDEKARQAIVENFDHWKTDSDLAGIRDEAALAKLPEGEREAFRSLWADVEALRVKAGRGK
jgi:eukaryotic-like serine/threonine-protein kinase